MASSTLGAPSFTSLTPTLSSSGSSEDPTAECLGCIISGRPFPAHLRPAAFVGASPTTVEAGIARILNGGRGV